MRERIRDRFYVERGKTKNYGGKTNRIILIENGHEKFVRHVPGCEIVFKGKNNVIKIHGPLKKLQLKVKMYGDSEIVIMPRIYRGRKIRVRGMHYCKLYVGSDLSTNSECLIDFVDKTDVHIGDDCMFSDFIEIRTGDGHVIKDVQTDEVLNHNKSVYIGNHVWLGRGVMVLKGANIPDSSVVGAHSVVTKRFEQNGIVIAGSPARVVKQNITWGRGAPDSM